MAEAFDKNNDKTAKWMSKHFHSQNQYAGMNVNFCANEMKRKQYRNSLIAQEGRIRSEIHSILISMLDSGKSRLEILVTLSSKPEYKKYSSYFKIWINQAYEKKQQHEQKKQSKEKEIWKK